MPFIAEQFFSQGEFVMNKKLLRNAFAGAAAVGGIATLAAGYAFAVRPWHLRWGATDEELTVRHF